MAWLQRRGALSLPLASSYRTVPEPVVLEIVGVVSIDLLVQEQTHLFQQGNEIGRDAVKTEARKLNLCHWQDCWNRKGRRRWAGTLVPNLKERIDRQYGETNYHLIQFLSGHDKFNVYLYRTTGKVQSPACQKSAYEDTLHTFLSAAN